MCRVGPSFLEAKVPHNNPEAAELNSPEEESDNVYVTNTVYYAFDTVLPIGRIKQLISKQRKHYNYCPFDVLKC